MTQETLEIIQNQPIVGLFGTCGESTFRQDLFIPEYTRRGIPYFNPQKGPGEWDGSQADVEADHLAYDAVQLWPVTPETYGGGSLSEVGFSIASTLRAETPLPKFVLPMIDLEVDPRLDIPAAREESIRARAIVKAHLERNESPYIIKVGSLEEMLDKSLKIFPAVVTIVDLVRSHNPAFKRFMKGRMESIAYAQALETGLRTRINPTP